MFCLYAHFYKHFGGRAMFFFPCFCCANYPVGTLILKILTKQIFTDYFVLWWSFLNLIKVSKYSFNINIELNPFIF